MPTDPLHKLDCEFMPLLPRPFLPFVGDDALVTVSVANRLCDDLAAGSQRLVLASDILQDVADYRGLLRAWFALLAVGGRLLIAVPHAFLCERELALPSQTHPQRRRVYTPATLAGELEEALEPNSYRVRLLCDHDEGYDYASEDEPDRAGSILAVIERIEPPEWGLGTGEACGDDVLDFSFDAPSTRRERVGLIAHRRIVILKLDHLGDFIMGVPALKKARAAFHDAEITLVVGDWNKTLALDLGLFEHVSTFDAFPRNSSEEKVDLAARALAFEAAFPETYDLAIDLRTDPDTRFFLRHLRAGVRAGMGTFAQFPFLDIFLPIDLSRHGFEAVEEIRIGLSDHIAALPCHRTPYRLAYEADAHHSASKCLVYGPYLNLRPGDYLYIPHIEIADVGDKLLELDVACDMQRASHRLASPHSTPQFRFAVGEPGAEFEFRIFSSSERITPSFSYFGGRLLRRGANSVLHQSEYLSLLIELVQMRSDQFGLLREDAEML